jgi:hypothetical protein
VSAAGVQHELGRYELPNGERRVLFGQRVDGRVAISDVPDCDDGRVLLVERHVESKAAMDGIVAAYIADSLERGEPAILVPRELGVGDDAS